MKDEGELLDLAIRISDGAAVDWARVERGEPAKAEPRVVRHLRLLESLSRAHRDIPSSDAPSRPPSLSATLSDVIEPLPFRWGRLEVRALLGRGGFGAVYRAWDATLQHEVALKLLEVEGRDSRRVEALLAEARTLAKLRHPNVVVVHNAEVHDGRLGIWMELVHGATFERLLAEQGRFGAKEATLVGLELCRALAAVHGAGLVHRDVKLSNVMRAEGGRIVLMDFGTTSAAAEAATEGRRKLTGTPLYMAPELLLGGSASANSDVYALGVSLYRLVTGGFPVEAESVGELAEKHRRRDARPLADARPDLPDAFVGVVEKALRAEPQGRFGSAGEMERALAATIGLDAPAPMPERRKLPRRSLLAAAAVLLAALLAAGAWLVLRPGAAGYEISATLLRQSAGAAQPRAIESGARLAVGDELTLEVRASKPVWVYVFNQDERGEAWALFPLPRLDLQNPLPPGQSHVLPGSRDGVGFAWRVTSSGERERLVILASAERQVEFEAELARLPRPAPDQVALPLPADAVRVLRGVGGIGPRRTPAGGVETDGLFDLARELSRGPERAEHVWLRQIELVNPAP